MNVSMLSEKNRIDKNFEATFLHGKVFSGDWKNAVFRQSVTGQTLLFSVLHQSAALLLSVFAGFTTAYAVAILFELFQDPDIKFSYLGVVIGAFLIAVCIITLWKGLTYILGAACCLIIIAVILTLAVADDQIAGGTALNTLSIGGAVAGIVGLATAIASTRQILLHVFFCALGLILGSGFGLKIQSTPLDLILLSLVSFSILGLGVYMGKCTLSFEVDPRYEILQTLSIHISNLGSTSFREADLTEADFSNSTLQKTDFSNAIILRTRWHNAKFYQNNFHGTYLANSQIRRLVSQIDGRGQNFDRFDLRGVNLDNAKLMGASFVGADLTNATLKGADLSHAKLAQTQLYGADFTGANLTGAFIPNWGISPETVFDDVQCNYIHMRLPSEEDRNQDRCRKPDNRNEDFRPGDFVDFIAPIIRTLDVYQQQSLSFGSLASYKTLDLYHYEGIDPSSAAIALQQLIDNHPKATIEVHSIEGRGYQKVRIQAQISGQADPSLLNSEYFESYNNLKTLAYPDLKTLLSNIKSKDNRIHNLEAMMMNALGSDRFYAETKRPTMATVLMLAANPKDTTRLRLDKEFQEIQAGLERASRRDFFVLQQRWAITPRTLRRALLDLKPRIIHFSGHGEGSSQDELQNEFIPEGLLLENEQGYSQLVSDQALADLFRIFANEIDCIILNACYSETQANAISKYIPYVIGMSHEIGDLAAIEFSIGFYDGLLAGKSIEIAYKLGCNAIQLQSIPGHLTPILKCRDS